MFFLFMEPRINVIHDNHTLLPSGRVEVHSTGQAIRNTVSRAEAAASVQHTNRGSWLKDWFDLQSKRQRVLHAEQHTDGKLGIIEPTGKYDYLDWLVVMADNEQLATKDDALVPVKRAVDVTPELHDRYLDMSLRVLLAAERRFPQNHALIEENDMQQITNADHRLSRSIGYVHSHVISSAPTDIKPGFVDNPHLRYERAFLRKVTGKLVDDLMTRQDGIGPIVKKGLENALADLKHSVSIGIRKQPPYGYSLKLNGITRENVLQNISTVRDIMRFNNIAYEAIEAQAREEAAEQMEKVAARYKQRFPDDDDFSIRPPLSRRQYTYFGPTGELTVLLSPQILSHGGPMEAKKVSCDRSPDYVDPYTREQYNSINQDVVDIVTGRAVLELHHLKKPTIIYSTAQAA